MESILTNLQKIEDLRVISRTSVEKYRHIPKTIPEMGKELNVKYFVEGSGQKIENRIMLHIQLIDAKSDKHLWSQQYERDAKDIFDLQSEVAKSIATEIEAVITPEEEERIDKVPTEDLVAYDYYLKGLDLLHKETREGLLEGIPWFEKAIEHDNEFAYAYAMIAIAYYYLDIYQIEKQYVGKINHYADKALLLDSKSSPSLMAKAMYYMNSGENELAVPYLEKALEYNPNSAMVINMLADFYTNVIPNSAKYLEYALKGIRLDVAAYDSATVSFIYLHISNALIQTGFPEESEKYIEKSLDYNPDNLYSQYVRAYILFAQNRDLSRTKELLLDVLEKDSMRIDIIQEVAKICYFMRDYKSAWKHYKRFLDIKREYNLDVYRSEHAKVGVVLSKLGMNEESEKYMDDFRDYAEQDNSIYKHLNMAMYHSYQGNIQEALEQLRLFSQEDNYFYWIIFLELDPLVDNLKDLPEYKKIFRETQAKFWKTHKKIKASLEKKKLI
jgi:tetratricopeptide (TPR) repeat protein